MTFPVRSLVGLVFVQTLFILTVVGISNAASIGDQCPLPTQLKRNYDFNWQTKPNEWNNTQSVPAFLQLVLSW